MSSSAQERQSATSRDRMLAAFTRSSPLAWVATRKSTSCARSPAMRCTSSDATPSIVVDHDEILLAEKTMERLRQQHGIEPGGDGTGVRRLSSDDEPGLSPDPLEDVGQGDAVGADRQEIVGILHDCGPGRLSSG